MINTTAEIEATLAKAEADWRQAQDELLRAQTARDKANADWDSLVSVSHRQEVDRRQPNSDRRQTNPARDTVTTSNQRNTDSDRRKSQSDFVAFSRTVSVRHEAYMSLSNAEAIWLEAKANLIRADIQRKRIAAGPIK